MSRSTTTLFAFLVLIGAACTSGGEDAVVDGATDASSTTSELNQPGASISEPANGETNATVPTTEAPSTVPPTTVVPVIDSAFRLTEVGDAPLGLLYWDDTSVRRQSHTGEFFEAATGPFVEVAEIPHDGVVFQRESTDNIIWYDGGSGPQELLVAGDNQRLTLEGTYVSENDEGVVFYQRHEDGAEPETTRSTLRWYNTVTKEVGEVTVTGGWEYGTAFSHVANEQAVGRWGGEGYFGLRQLDAFFGDVIYNTNETGLECFDGDQLCPNYDQATLFKGEIYGVGAVYNTQRSLVDAFGIYHFDRETLVQEVLIQFPWDNGLWYPEDMFAFGNYIIISLDDGQGNPLPGLVFDPASGEAWTLPQQAFVRPGYLS